MPRVEVRGMDFMEIGWRVVNAFLGTIALLGLLTRIVQMWDSYTERLRLLAMALALFLMNTVYGSIEQIAQGSDFGMRVCFTTIGLLWTMHALFRTEPGYTRDDPYHTPKYGS